MQSSVGVLAHCLAVQQCLGTGYGPRHAARQPHARQITNIEVNYHDIVSVS